MANFDKMTDDGRKLFLGYDQENMIRKYGLPHNEEYLYFWMLGRIYRISREFGNVEEYTVPVCFANWDIFKNAAEYGRAAALDEQCWKPADNSAAMTFYDVLCYGKEDAAATKQYINLNSLVNMISAAGNPGGGMYGKYEPYFDSRSAQLEDVLKELDGVPEGKGDIAYEMPLFDFMNVRFQLWHADDEFPASIQIYVDTGILTYMHFETVWYVMGLYLHQIKEMIG